MLSVALFVANLRLLDLDLRSDWPSITEKTYDTKDALQNQKRRIACTEWALYRLFECHDPVVTRKVRTCVDRHESQIAYTCAEIEALLPSSRATAVDQPARSTVPISE